MIVRIEDRLRRPAPADPMRKPGGDGDDGPSSPKVNRPNPNDLLKRMKRVDPDQARRYRQRSGE
ncbi:MAG TPA: ubiquitin-like protein UBact [Armatimonadota bacterium]|nr:ubiquitin-like protein UBact [Armatimonadota bacterium]